MKIIASTAVAVHLFLGAGILLGQATPALTVQRTITLPDVKGKFDHFAMDEAGNRLFAAATGNQSVEVIDLKTDRVVDSLRGLGKPHGLAWVPNAGLLFVADGSKAQLTVFSGLPLKQVKTIPLSDDADDMVYDEADKILYVGHGGANAANPAKVAVIDISTLTLVANLSVASHPEALELDPRGGRIFVNIADDGQVAVIDSKTKTLVTTWHLKNAKGNTPLAYDVEDNLVILGCRTPAQVVVLNGKTGEEIASAPSNAGADDLFYDAAARRIYLIAGSGTVDSFALTSGGKLEQHTVTHTVPGAKTGLLVPGQRSLYVGLPGVNEPSSIRIYQTLTK